MLNYNIFQQHISYIHGNYGSANQQVTSKFHPNHQHCFHSILDATHLKWRKEKKYFHHENFVDEKGIGRGFAPTNRLISVQTGSHIWILGGGYTGYEAFNQIYEPGMTKIVK